MSLYHSVYVVLKLMVEYHPFFLLVLVSRVSAALSTVEFPWLIPYTGVWDILVSVDL